MCLRSDIEGDQDLQFENVKLRIYLLISPLIPIIFISLKSYRVNKYLQGFCPNGRFSCIGSYKRNVIDIKTTSIWFIYLCMSSLVDVGLDIVFTYFEDILSPATIFWIWNIKGIFSNDFLNLLLPLTLTTKDIVPYGNSNRRQQFYTRKPVILEPRRPVINIQASNISAVNLVQEFSPKS